MTSVLLDSDIILDFFFDRAPFSQDTAKILSLCEKNQIEAYVTPITISNVYYLLRKTAPHHQVMSHLRLLMSIIHVLEVSKDVVLTAIDSSFKDFEDALQNFAAESTTKIDVIITRNVKDYRKSALSVQTPDIFLKTI